MRNPSWKPGGGGQVHGRKRPGCSGGYKVRRQVLFIDSMPLTATGKERKSPLAYHVFGKPVA